MRQLGIQIVLIVGMLAIAWRLLISQGQKAQALRRLGLLFFAAFAVWSILDPRGLLTNLADVLGVGRAADLILYGLVLAFLGFVATTFRRFRDMEVRYTRLARRIALDETETAAAHRWRPDTGAAATVTTTDTAVPGGSTDTGAGDAD